MCFTVVIAATKLFREAMRQKAAGGFRHGRSKITTKDLLSEICGMYESDNENTLAEKVITLRSALDLVLGQDRAW